MRNFYLLTLSACLLACAGPSAAAPLVKEFFDKDFGWNSATFTILNTWDSSILSQSGGATGQSATQFGGKPTPGEVGAAFRNIQTSIPQLAAGATAGLNFAHINNTFAWNPATDGVIGRMEFSFDLRTTERFGHFYRPILRQDGTIYRLNGSVASVPSPALGDWSANPFVFVFDSMNVWTSGATAPNFAANGTPIEFGFEGGILGSCPAGGGSCAFVSTTSGLDNYFVRVSEASETDPAAIPEPSTMLTLGAALAGLASFRRR